MILPRTVIIIVGIFLLIIPTISFLFVLLINYLKGM